MTLDDLERPKCTPVEKMIYEANQKNLNEDRPIIIIRPMILVSRNIWYVRIFAGVMTRGGVVKDGNYHRFH